MKKRNLFLCVLVAFFVLWPQPEPQAAPNIRIPKIKIRIEEIRPAGQEGEETENVPPPIESAKKALPAKAGNEAAVLDNITKLISMLRNKEWKQAPEHCEFRKGANDDWETIQAVFVIDKETISICHRSHALDPGLESLVINIHSGDHLIQVATYPVAGKVAIGEIFNIKTGLWSQTMVASPEDDEKRLEDPEHVGTSQGLEYRARYQKAYERSILKMIKWLETPPIDTRFTI